MNSAHLHLILNHIPIFTSVFGLILIIASRLGTRIPTLRIGLYTLIAGALLTIPAYLTGEPAEQIVEHVGGIASGSIDAHEQMAGIALACAALLGVVATVMAYRIYVATNIARSLVVGLIALTTTSVALFGVTAYFGGQIHHTEIASGGGATNHNVNGADED